MLNIPKRKRKSNKQLLLMQVTTIVQYLSFPDCYLKGNRHQEEEPRYCNDGLESQAQSC